MEIDTFREQRSPVLIATFMDGYVNGWRFAVPEAFRNSLDIKLTPIKIGTKTVDIYTQGKQFSFNKGATLYDNRLAYELEWGEALKRIKLSVQIEEVVGSDYVTTETIETVAKNIDVLIQKRDKSKNELSEPKQKTIDGLNIKKQRMQFGNLKFKVFRPTKDKNSVEELETIECDQEEFVVFLQTGTIRTIDDKRRNLFQEFAH